MQLLKKCPKELNELANGEKENILHRSGEQTFKENGKVRIYSKLVLNDLFL